MQLRKATRQQAKIRLGLSGPSGSGKTYTALLIAFGITNDWTKIAVIDSENGSADLYSNLGEYNVLPITAFYEPEKYISAIEACEKAEMEVIIIDSITHEWSGKGGCLDIHERETAAMKIPNSFTAWAKVTPRHQSFVDKILQSKCHIITTVRSKTDYVLAEKNGKQVPQKVGMAAQTRDGFEFELTLSLDMDQDHKAFSSKDRTQLFAGKPPFIPSSETGKMIKEWCESGVDQETLHKEELTNAISNLKNCKTIDDLTMLRQGLSNYVVNHESFKEAGLTRYNEINKPKEQTA